MVEAIVSQLTALRVPRAVIGVEDFGWISSSPGKGEDSSRDLRSRCRFAVHSRALVRKKAPRAATACPAAVPCWVLHGARFALTDTSRLTRYINISFETRCTRFLPHLKVGASARRYW